MPTRKHRYTITSNEKVEFVLRRSGEEAIRQESEAEDAYEQRRRAAAKRLAARFMQLEGLDHEALSEASVRWLRA
jgi:hypothetical protein